MGLFERFPYTNFHELNLDWILQQITSMKTEFSDFISQNSIKYADPILWDITRQYERNTVVVDATGNGYLSVKAVPGGISIDRTDYWTVIGNFSLLWGSVRNAITKENEGHSPTATKNRSIGDLVWQNDILLEITKNMNAGDAYIIESNCRVYSMQILLTELTNAIEAEVSARIKAVDDMIELIDAEETARMNADNDLQAAIDAEETARTNADIDLQAAIDAEKIARTNADIDLQAAIDAEKTARTNAVNSLQDHIDTSIEAEETARTTADNDLQAAIDTEETTRTNEVNDIRADIERVTLICPEDFGAVGDGVTDDTSAVQAAFNYLGTKLKGKLIFYHDYAVTHVQCKLAINCDIDFNGFKLIGIATQPTSSILEINANYSNWYDLYVDGRLNEKYTCGVQIRPLEEEGVLKYAPQFNTFFGFTVNSVIYGLLYGELPGQNTISSPSSENNFFGFKNYSCNIPVCVNQKGTYINFIGCSFIANRGEWQLLSNPTKYSDNNSICFRCDNGDVTIVNSEIAKTDTPNGYGIWGAGISIFNTTWEVAGVQGFITGNVVIDTINNGYVGNNTKELFVINGGIAGTLVLRNATFRRKIAGGAQTFICTSSGSPMFEVILDNVTFAGQKFNDKFTYHVKCNMNNVKFLPEGTWNESVESPNIYGSPAYLLSTNKELFNISKFASDITNDTVINGLEYNGWKIENINSTDTPYFWKVGVKPTNSYLQYSIQFYSGNGIASLRSKNLEAVSEGDIINISLAGMLESGNAPSINVIYYGIDGTTVVNTQNLDTISTYTFERYNVHSLVPANAYKAQFELKGDNTKVYITDVSITK